MIENGEVQLIDGRRLGYAEYGDLRGVPVLYFHGAPGCSREARLLHAAAPVRELRVIAPDRPGYGRSESCPTSRLGNWPEAVAQLADALGLGSFAVLGVSGGGPYALACAWRLKERVTAAALVCALAPMDSPEAFRDMAGSERFMLELARRRPGVVRYVVSVLTWLIRRDPDRFFARIARTTAEPDRRVLERPLVRTVLALSLKEAVRVGAAGLLSDLRNYTRPWEFDPQTVDLPVQLWHGAQDRTVPVQSSRRLARRLPHCRLIELGGEGHYSLPLNHMGEILDGLVRAAQRI
ncbi:MAG: alpha/beta hydrolase [Gammaproteobacteria bacterium]